jgi:hypothetical protein
VPDTPIPPAPNRSSNPDDHVEPSKGPPSDKATAHYWLDRMRAQLGRPPQPAAPRPGQAQLDVSPDGD